MHGRVQLINHNRVAVACSSAFRFERPSCSARFRKLATARGAPLTVVANCESQLDCRPRFHSIGGEKLRLVHRHDDPKG